MKVTITLKRRHEEELLNYELRVAWFGGENERIICVGINYADCLLNNKLGDEAMNLLTKLLAMSNQVLGTHYHVTKMVEAKLLCCLKA